MGVVPPRFAVEIHGRIARIIGRGRRACVLPTETLETRPGFEQRAIDREVFIREQPGLSRLAADGIKERPGDIALQQTVTILAEGCRRPNRRIHAQPDKPAIQHAVVDLFHQQPLAPDRVERLDQQRPQQLLGRNRRPADVRIHPREAGRQLREHAVGHRPNRAQRMVGADAPLGREVTEHVVRLIVRSTHRSAPFSRFGSMVVRRNRRVDPGPVTFSAPC